MHRMAPYQAGVSIAEYVNRRCQLCHIQPSRLVINAIETVTNPVTRLSHYLNSGLLCSHCQDSIVWLPPSFAVDIAPAISLSIQAATYYHYPIRPAFRAFKHYEDISKLPLLVHILRQLPRPKGCHHANSVIVPMPTTNSRLRKRGFDPVTILSAYLAKHWQIPLWKGVQRTDSTLSQQGLTRAERLSNLDNAFAVTKSPTVKRLLLFDDIATTGASLQALATTLHAHCQPSSRQLINNSAEHASTEHPSINNPSIHTPYHMTAYAIAHGSNDSL